MFGIQVVCLTNQFDQLLRNNLLMSDEVLQTSSLFPVIMSFATATDWNKRCLALTVWQFVTG
jgi:hypothetical protein